jgi:hypothetical protein
MHDPNNDPQELAAQQPPAPDDVPAWEQVQPGRFMPRRVRGSCRGLALG